MFRIFFNEYVVSKIPRNVLSWLLFLMTLLMLTNYANILVLAQTCSNLKFPLTLGFTSGETEIVSID